MNTEKTRWLDDPTHVTLLFRGLVAACVLLVAMDLFIHRHEEFSFATLFGFHGLYGFFACTALVLAAKQMRRWLMRREDYYDE